MKEIRPIVALLTAFSLMVFNVTAFVYPEPAQASIKTSGIALTSCIVGGKVASVISDKIKEKLGEKVNEAIAKVGDKVDSAIDAGITTGLNAVAGLFGFGNLFQRTQPTYDKSTSKLLQQLIGTYDDKNYRDDIVARCISRTILNNMIANINTVVRTSGRDGGPTFITNWNNFQTQAQYRGENIVRAELSTAKLCDYLASDVKKTFGVDPKTKTPVTGQNLRTNSLQTFSLQTNCTLPAGFTPQKYQQDFSGQGGWDTFVRLLEPQNNIYGLTAISQNEIQRQRALAVSADANQAIANGGQLGISGSGKADSCVSVGPNGQCLTYKQIKTPGSVVGANIAASINAEFNWITSAQGLGSIIENATEVMLNRLLDFGNPDEGSYRAVDENPTGVPSFNIPTATPYPAGGGDGPQATCTSTGTAEQAFMLPLLNGGSTPPDVVAQTNTKFSLTIGNEAVYYAASNTIGLPEFYMAGPTSSRPVSPTTGQAWDVVVRCTTANGTNPGNGTGNQGGDTGNNPPAI